MMSTQEIVYPSCRNALNPHHECSESCFKVITETKARTDQNQSGTDMGPEFEACVECTEKCFRVHGKKRDASPVLTSFVTVMSGNECFKSMELPPSVALAVSLVDQFTSIEDSQGRRWNVAISSINGTFAFHHGWNAFSSDHDLQLGNILVFTYIKGSHFAVKIYDNSGCELNSFVTNHKNRKRDDRDPDLKGGWCYATDTSAMSKNGSCTCGCSHVQKIKRLDQVNGKKKTPTTTQHASSKCNNRNKAGTVDSALGQDIGSTNILPDGSELGRTLKYNYVNVKEEEPSDIYSLAETFGFPVIPEANEETITAGSGGDEAISSDKIFVPDHPTFTVVMQEPSYLNKALNIDIAFAQKYICKGGNCDVNLQIPNGRTWPVVCSVTDKKEDAIRYNREGVARNRYPSYCIKSVLLSAREEVARIRYQGWIKFATDNVLQVGDTCVFEMIKQQHNKTFLVHILRAIKAY